MTKSYEEQLDFAKKHYELNKKYCVDNKKYHRCYIDSNCRNCKYWKEIMEGKK